MGKGIWQYHTIFQSQAQMNVSQMLAGLEKANAFLGKKTASPFPRKSRKGSQAEADAEGTEAIGGAAGAASRAEDAAREEGRAGDGRMGAGRTTAESGGAGTGADRAAGADKASGADDRRTGAGGMAGRSGACVGHAHRGQAAGNIGLNAAYPDPEMLRWAVVWSEILGEPAAKRRRRERSGQKQ